MTEQQKAELIRRWKALTEDQKTGWVTGLAYGVTRVRRDLDQAGAVKQQDQVIIPPCKAGDTGV